MIEDVGLTNKNARQKSVEFLKIPTKCIDCLFAEINPC